MNKSELDFEKQIRLAKLRLPPEKELILRQNLEILMQKIIFIESIDDVVKPIDWA
jgi:hypothetical protein